MSTAKINSLLLALLLIISCTPEGKKKQHSNMKDNPLLMEWKTPFSVPPFDLIKDTDYLPAFKEAIKQHQSEIEKITSTSATPSFENTIEQFEYSGALLARVRQVFFAVNAANTNDTLKKVAKEVAPLLSNHKDSYLLNEKLFLRIKSVYELKNSLALSPESTRLIEETYKTFVRAGANADEDQKKRLREINAKLAELTQEFGEHVLSETNAYDLHITEEKDLGSLSEGSIANAAAEATKRGHDSGWSFTLQRPSINPFLQASPNAKARKKLFDAYTLRGDNNNSFDNKTIVSEIIKLRIEKAKILGYSSHANYVLSNAMAKTPEAVLNLLNQLWGPSLEKAKEELNLLKQKKINSGDQSVFTASDWRYYVEQVRQERYDFDEASTRPYFEFTAVLQGAFTLADRLFGLQFIERTDIPKWHQDQKVYEVTEANGKHIGLLYMDFFARESKRGGAWMNAIRVQSKQMGKMIYPIVTNNFNYPAPTATTPSLLTFREAQTLFHEFGHGLHGLLSNVTYPSFAGTSVPRDFVEFPSQVMENWMSEPEVLKLYAKHYQTGELIPSNLIEKMNKANAFNQGFATVEYMAAAYLDLYWHNLSTPSNKNINRFEKEVLKKIGLLAEIAPRYRSTYFQHIFSGGYSASYYGYQWSEVLDADAFAAFTETGDLFNPEVAKKYRALLSKGGSEDGMELIKRFRGRAPRIDALLKKKGF